MGNTSRHATPLLAWAVPVLALPAGALGAQGPPAAAEEHPFEADLRAFEARDRESPPPQDAILFVGSSSIRGWDLDRDFPGLVTLNRGFGGSQMADAAHFADRLIIPYRPRLVVLYEGDNDLAAGKTPEAVLNDFTSLVATINRALPDTRVLVLSIKPSIARRHLIEQMRQTNALLQAAAQRDERLIYVDVFSPMLDERGEVRPELLAEDGLHLNAAGYAAWAAIVRPCLMPTPAVGPQRFRATTAPSVEPQ